MNEPKEPDHSPGSRPHSDRIRLIESTLREGKTGAICIDNTEEHRAWYLHEIAKYLTLRIEYQGNLTDLIYLIKVKKLPSQN